MGLENQLQKRNPVEEPKRYPDAMSRNFGEGGYTFLKRSLAQAVQSGKPVIINSGRNYLEYEYKPEQTTFMEGVTLLEGDDTEALEGFRGVADTYMVQQGIEELTKESK